MSEVLEPTTQDWTGPKTVEEAQCYHQGFIGGATAYARERGDSTLKTGNEILGKLMTEQAWKTVEAMESTMAAEDAVQERMLRWFEYLHLPPALQEISKPFGELAKSICRSVPGGPERTVSLRKLLEAKDAAVRAKLNPGC